MAKKTCRYVVEMKSPAASDFSIFRVFDSKKKSVQNMKAVLQRDTDKFDSYVFRLVKETTKRKTIISPFTYYDQVTS